MSASKSRLIFPTPTARKMSRSLSRTSTCGGCRFPCGSTNSRSKEFPLEKSAGTRRIIKCPGRVPGSTNPHSTEVHPMDTKAPREEFATLHAQAGQVLTTASEAKRELTPEEKEANTKR